MSRYSALVFIVTVSLHAWSAERWSEQKTESWYQQQPWLVGSNYIPANAINQLEMWQAESFDPALIDRELGWAENIGMNTMRVFLHDLLWQQDAAGFRTRIDQFLTIASKHHIRPMFVLFDSCWDPEPKLGRQHPPIPGVHNSGWVQSPGAHALSDAAQYARLKDYVQGVIGAFANDSRVLAWDLWNEPNDGQGVYAKAEAKNKIDYEKKLLPQVFEWARSAHASQPLTSGLWEGDWSSIEKMSPIARIQLDQSDLISFHNYGWPEDFEQHVRWLEQYHRPLICTEYMARGAGSTFDTVLPLAKRHHVGAINWGLVAGKSQTYLPWDSWEKPYVLSAPPIWFHDVFRADGSPYRSRETEIIRKLTRETSAAAAP
ncbi:MAG: cellulase family glycosylhydrolase [Acidobacteria bacterium]|nr:cellulase family glycosylhydrolase [Acidobacteriota bacterium]